MSADDGLYDVIVETLRLYGIHGETLGSLRPQAVARAVLALPEVAALRAKAAAADRVRELAEAFSKPEPGETFAAQVVTAAVAVRIHRALDGPPC